MRNLLYALIAVGLVVYGLGRMFDASQTRHTANITHVAKLQ